MLNPEWGKLIHCSDRGNGCWRFCISYTKYLHTISVQAKTGGFLFVQVGKGVRCKGAFRKLHHFTVIPNHI